MINLLKKCVPSLRANAVSVAISIIQADTHAPAVLSMTVTVGQIATDFSLANTNKWNGRIIYKKK